MILVDTGPLVALCDTRDELHHRALGEVDRLRTRQIVALTAVLCEACFLLDTQALRARLRAIIAKLDIVSRVEEHEAAFREAVFAWLERYSDHQPDFADACLAVAAGWQRVEVWTFDSEFTTTWRRADGSRIPVAFAASSRRRKRRPRR